MSIRIRKNYTNCENNSFEILLNKIFSKQVKEQDFARKLYDCLCNTIWYNKNTNDIYSCSFRYAGSIVANLRDQGENYIDFYCNSFDCEGSYHEEIYKELEKNGYKAIKYKEINNLQKYKFTGVL